MQIHCFGGAREVGRNAFFVDGKTKLLLDFGLKVEEGEMPVNTPKVDGVFICHSHLDHCGAVPALYKKNTPTQYATAPTFDLSALLWKDAQKVARIKHHPVHFTDKEIAKAKKFQHKVTYGQQFDVGAASVEVFDAGHIPGSMITVIDMQKKRIAYTSDFKLESTRLLNGANFKIKGVDALIMESTYASRDHTPRRETEKQLFEYVRNTVSSGGVALLPTFAVGRSAEVLMVLDSFKFDFPIYLDGMAREATEIALRYPEFIRDHRALERAMEDVKHISGSEERSKVVKKPCAIVTTGGMMEGGPIIQYMKYLYNSPQSSIIFTGFCPPKTAARYLLDTGRFVNEELDFKVKMNIQQFDLSAHAGRTDLFKMVQKTNPKKIVCIHGDDCQRFAQELRSRGYDAVAPMLGETVDI